MKLDGVGRRERVQDSSLIKSAVHLRKTVDSHWRFLYRPLYFVFTLASGDLYDDMDLHDWELDLLEDSLLASLKLTNERFIVGLAIGKKPIYQEDFSTGFINVLSTEIEVSGIRYHVEAYGPMKKG